MSGSRPLSVSGFSLTGGKACRQAFFACLLALAGVAAAAADAPPGAEYLAQFVLDLRPGKPTAAARIRIVQTERRLKRLRLKMPAGEFSAVSGDGRVTRKGDSVTWEIPVRGGELRYDVVITHRRNDKGYDALVTEQWTLFRVDDMFPAAAAVHKAGARGRGELLLGLPSGWSGVTPYLPDPENRLRFSHPTRRYARPVGWILAGRIGSRMDVIGPTMVRIAAPRGQRVQRVPMLALIRATLPVLQAELPRVPPYLLIVTAGEPMWRGGLSAPNSFFVHADRPLISENGTSTLIHEVVHVVAPVPADRNEDWIDEGLAEYLGLVLLLRGQAISRERFDHAIATFRRRGARVRSMLTRSASGTVTARAVTIFHDLDEELRRRSRNDSDIFELLRRMMLETEPLDITRLRALASALLDGAEAEALAPGKVPGLP